MKDLTELGDRFLLAMLRWCGYGRPRFRPLREWHVYVGLLGNEPVGISGLYRETDIPGDLDWLGWFGVRPAYRRRGIGLRILQQTIEISASRNSTRIVLHTDPHGASVHRFYESAGFRRLGVSEDVLPESAFDNFDRGDLIFEYRIKPVPNVIL
jgi:GNAT superfamily N-acetyltransferase